MDDYFKDVESYYGEDVGVKWGVSIPFNNFVSLSVAVYFSYVYLL